MIVYTSADSVLQICGNEDPAIMGLSELYRYCEIARRLTMHDEWKVGRVIARPYIKTADGAYQRISNCRDYALKPSVKSVLNDLQTGGLDVIAIGKINDIFHGEGITDVYHSKSSVHGMEQLLDIMKQDFHGNDPVFKGSDHTRELVPLLMYSPSCKGRGLLLYSDSFACIGATIAENFHIAMSPIGTSYKNMLK